MTAIETRKRSDFVVSSAVDAARRVLADRDRFELDAEVGGLGEVLAESIAPTRETDSEHQS